MKQCNKCMQFKEESTKFFELRPETGNLRGTCRVCRNARPRNPIIRKANRKRYVKKHHEAIKAYMKLYCRKPAMTRSTGIKLNLLPRSCTKCGNPGKFLYRVSICDDCYLKHKRTKDSRNGKARRSSDPAVKLRKYISNSIGRALRRARGSKRGNSVMQYLPYDMSQLISHLESLWEPWMDWSNYGSPRLGERKWHIDHKIPQDLFIFMSMSDPKFLECWSLNNLRPLEAFANMQKSNKVMP